MTTRRVTARRVTARRVTARRVTARRVTTRRVTARRVIPAVLAATLAGCGGAAATASHPPAPPTPPAPAATAAAVTPISASVPAAAPAPAPAAPTAPVAAARSAATPAPAGGPLAGRTVVVDPGHNGGNGANPGIINRLVPDGRGGRKPCNTTGTATAGGYDEAAFNWSVGTALRRLLVAAGAKVVMTRSSNTGVGPCVNVRAAIGNAAHADAVIAIHADGGPSGGRGFHVIYPPDAGGTAVIYRSSLRLARAVHGALVAASVFPTSTYLGQGGYDERSDLAGLNLSRRPAIFVELGNMANRTDAALQTQPSVRRQLARALARGVTRFLLGR